MHVHTHTYAHIHIYTCTLMHTQLKSVLSNLAQSLACDIEGVATDSVHDILRGKVTKLSQDHRQATQQMEKCRDELEQTRGELAATNVKYTNTESQLIQCRSELERERTEVKQLKVSYIG